MKSLVWMPVVIVLSAGAALLLLRALTGAAHLRELLFAGGIALISAELAMLPIILARRSAQIAMAQAALVGTVLHMFLMLAMGGAAFGLHLVGERQLFLFLLLGLYWVSLIFIVIAMIKAVRGALPESRSGGAAGGAPTP